MSNYREYELTSFQRQLWDAWAKDHLCPHASIDLQYRLSGELDIERLNDALKKLIHATPALRTYFIEEAGQVRQAVLAHHVQCFTVSNFDNLAAADAYRKEIIAFPMDFRQFPATHYHLIQYDQTHYFLIIILPGILSDDISNHYLLQRLSMIYNNPSLVIMPDFGIGQYQQFINTTAFKDNEITAAHYWTERLRGGRFHVNFNMPPSNLKTELTEKRYFFKIDGDTYTALKKRTKSSKVSTFSVMMALYKVMAFYLFEQKDVIIAYHANARPELNEFKNLFGFYVNTMLFRLDIPENMTFSMLIKQIHAQRELDNVYRSYNVSKLALTQSEVISPISTTYYNLLLSERVFSESIFLEGINSKAIQTERQCASADLGLYYCDSGSELMLAFECQDSLFTDVMIERMADYFKKLTKHCLNQPQKVIADFKQLPSYFNTCLMDNINATEEKFESSDLLHVLVEQQCKQTPDAPAIIFLGACMSYVELNTQANQMAHYWLIMGVMPGDRIAIYMERCMLLPALLLSCLKVGAVYLPLDTRAPEEQTLSMIHDYKPRYIMVDRSEKTSLFEDWRSQIIVLKNSNFDQYIIKNPRVKLSKESMVNIFYRSDSVETLKSVCVAHKALVNRVLWMQKRFVLAKGTRVLLKSPLACNESSWEIFWPLVVGATVIIGEPGIENNELALLRTLNQYAIEVVHFLPSSLQRFLHRTSPHAASTLKWVFCSGEALSTSLVKKFFEFSRASLYSFYGPADAFIDATYANARDFYHTPGPVVPVGKPIANMKLYILNRNLCPVLPGMQGELYLSGVGLAKKYFKQPALTKYAFIKNPYASTEEHRIMYKTGDLAYYSEDGYIYYAGQVDNKIKINEVSANIVQSQEVRAEKSMEEVVV